MLPRLYYISQGNSTEEHLNNISDALEAGVKLVQLRLKNVTTEEFTEATRKAKALCARYEAMLVVNDNVEVAAKTEAEALHLGLNDMEVEKAREKNSAVLIGGTANTMQQVRQRHSEKVDYIGLGPYRFTTTKEKLSPVLGAEGYKAIIAQMRRENIAIPVYAIGGIELGDVRELISCGVHGIAVSGLITHSVNKKELVKELNKIMDHA